MKAAIVYDSGTHTTKKMKSWADVFVAYFQRGIKRNIVSRLGIEIEHFIVSHKRPHRIAYKPHPDDFAYKVSRGHLKTLIGNFRGLDLNFTISD